eukprot:GFYU01000004.1.p1 GENE.GFYU01000004.1~~GFYU01000004.1.p1  ORF type:complete len:164 (-),score=52.25 GFYU01000004.1:124-558(-)
MVAIEIQKDFGLVILAIGASWFVNFYQTFLVIKARKKYNVTYPDLYAPESHKNAKEFNSVQRGHQQSLESWGPVMILAILNGLVYPRAAAALYATYSVGKAIYANGYASGGPSGRSLGGKISHLGDLPLFLLTFYTGATVAGLI